MNDTPLRLVGLRGATTCAANTTTDIRQAVRELIDDLVSRNGISPAQIVSVTFSVTADLDACFPAAEARQRNGWDSVALLDCQRWPFRATCAVASECWPMCGCRLSRPPGTHTWVKPVDCDQTDLVITDSSAAGPGTAPPGMGLRRIPLTE